MIFFSQTQDGGAGCCVEVKAEGFELIDDRLHLVEVTGLFSFQQDAECAGHGQTQSARKAASQAVVEYDERISGFLC